MTTNEGPSITIRGPRKDLRNRRFGRLIAMEPARTNDNKSAWRCICDCGREVVVRPYSLSGSSRPTQSCGCIRKGHPPTCFRHGKEGTPAYRVWSSMKGRCLNKDSQYYSHYGARGIVVCERWMDFKNFYADMGDPPLGMSIDRIDNNGNYEPSNCRWATQQQQGRNTRKNRIIRAFGETKTVADWADDQRCTVPYGTLYARLFRYGFTNEAAISKPRQPITTQESEPEE